jgi:hypothetical protein
MACHTQQGLADLQFLKPTEYNSLILTTKSQITPPFPASALTCGKSWR